MLAAHATPVSAARCAREAWEGQKCLGLRQTSTAAARSWSSSRAGDQACVKTEVALHVLAAIPSAGIGTVLTGVTSRQICHNVVGATS